MPTTHSHRARYAPLRRDTTSTSRSSTSYSSHIQTAYLQIRSYLDRTWLAFLALPPEQRYILYLVLGVKFLILGIVVYIGPEAMFDATAKLAIWFGTQPFGAALLVALVVVVSFPPLVGYGTSITLCGLGWGVHAEATSSHPELNGNLLQAWLLASTACLLGATVSFSVLRFLIIHHSKRVSWISSTLNDPKYVALSTAVRRRGLSMAILIRFCPFPFAYSNLFFASLVDAVSFKHFLTATALITPKLFLHVWLGTRMFQLMDREERAHLDGWAKVLNVVYIGVGSAIGVATGWIVWKETKKVLEAIEREQQQQLAEAHRQDSGSSSNGASQQHRTTSNSPYSDAPEPGKGEADQGASPFILDLDEDADADQVEDYVGHASRDSTSTNGLLPK
ncbi:uncharacterized protein UTRI_01202_B [Ustilago trichophora]|uniref:Golgi apparatus membrane protein TVP38 n=1 Tax=Ustilago trichophora TaxID=86804 RepID=A0A5C3DXG1_9BASI|nr:uncharacterized protein UTRI_01202_B [Ustilago trichophora]